MGIAFKAKGGLTSVCTRQPTAWFFKGSAPAKMPLVEGSLAGPVAGETRRWAPQKAVSVDVV
jgi:hypothetical protein